MPEITLSVHNKVGLHARPAALFVQTAKSFESDIKVAHGEREANAKSILAVLTLGVEQGQAITIRAEGADAMQALAALQTLVEDNFEASPEPVEGASPEPVEGASPEPVEGDAE